MGEITVNVMNQIKLVVDKDYLQTGQHDIKFFCLINIRLDKFINQLAE